VAAYRQDVAKRSVPRYDADDPAMLFQRLIGLANRETAGASTMFMYESGLTFPQIIVMYVLTWMGPLPISALAERLRLSLAATSQLVDRLVEGGYVAREEDADDRRVRRVRMRAHGERFMDRLNEIRRRELAAAFDKLPPGVKARLTDVLRDAVRSLAGVTETAPARGPSAGRHR
jgi:DNA-binding MarR family transcriptional regulator